MKKKNFILRIEIIEVNVDGHVNIAGNEYKQFCSYEKMMNYINQYVARRIQVFDSLCEPIEIKTYHEKSRIILSINNYGYHSKTIFKWKRL